MPILTSILLIPFLAALVIALIPRNYRFVIRSVALLATLVTMALAITMFASFQTGLPGYQFEHHIPWVVSLGMSYHVGVDGINVGLLLMGAIVAFTATCAAKEIQTREKTFYFLLMIMIGGILGAFASLDLFFFYFFHELALVPTFIMIGIWGHGERKNYATFQITMYLSLGALIALIGLIALYVGAGASNSGPADRMQAASYLKEHPAVVATTAKARASIKPAVVVTNLPALNATNQVVALGTNDVAVAGIRTFDIPKLAKYLEKHPLSLQSQHMIFPLLLFGFGILVSLWPFHSWAPLGYGCAPTPTAMLHAGVLKKFGLYGLIRIALPMVPEGARLWMHILAVLCLGNILYCGWVAMRQRDLNLLIGNSSVAHMGFIFLGIASLTLIGVTGAVVVMIAHGFLAALTFMLSGYLRQQTGTLEISKFGGLLQRLPFIGTAMILAMFAGCGLPGFANFVGEIMVFFGAWKGYTLWVVFAAWGGLIIGAIYMLRGVRNIFHGPATTECPNLKDAAGLWRKLPFALLLGALFLFGFVPSLLTSKIEPPVREIIQQVNKEDLQKVLLKKVKTTVKAVKGVKK